MLIACLGMTQGRDVLNLSKTKKDAIIEMSKSAHVPSVKVVMATALLLLCTTNAAAEKEKVVGASNIEIPSLEQIDEIRVQVRGTESTTAHKKFSKVATGLHEELLKYLKGYGCFENVVSLEEGAPFQASALEIRVLITDFKYTGAGRYVGGIAAGRARLGVEVDIGGSGDGDTLSEFSLSAQSKRIHGAFGTTSVIQVAQISDVIARAVSSQKCPIPEDLDVDS